MNIEGDGLLSPPKVNYDGEIRELLPLSKPCL